MSNHKIVNLAEPTEDGDAVNRKWAKDNFPVKGQAGGYTINGPLYMDGNAISGVADPAANGDVMTLGYANTHFLPLSGGTLTGALNMGNHKVTHVGAPTEDNDVVTKKYYEDHMSIGCWILMGHYVGDLYWGHRHDQEGNH